jgi:hypothetical protein
MPRKQRPTLYKKKYCEELIDFGEHGKSVVAFCAKLGIHKDTFYTWTHKHAEFTEAFKKYRAKCEAYWINLGMAGLSGKIKGFNAAVWIFYMKAVHQWRENTHVQPDNVESLDFVQSEEK